MKTKISVTQSPPIIKKRDRRIISLEKITTALKIFTPNITFEDVSKKIHSLRSQYSKEKAKVRAASKSGAGTEDVYKPSLWFFEKLNFLDDGSDPRETRSTLEINYCSNIGTEEPPIDDEDLCDVGLQRGGSTVASSSANIVTEYEHNSQIQSIVPEIFESPKTGSIPSRKRKLHDSEGTSSKDVMDAALKRLAGPKDPKKRDKFDAFGEMVAFEMRELPVQQCNIAKKYFVMFCSLHPKNS